MYIAQLEFKRIQTFLFASSRLRDMVAANALLGHTLRIELVKAAIESGSCNTKKNSTPQTRSHAEISSWPTEEMFQHGILSRDGGHFYALFPDETKANLFITKAHTILRNNLPGILAEYTTFEHDSQQQEHSFTPLVITQPPELPIFARCQQSGQGIAEKDSGRQLHNDHDKNKKVYISQTTKIKNNHFYDTFSPQVEFTSGDYASEVMQIWVNDNKSISDFDTLVGNDYLAVISADGNNMGARFKQYLSKEVPNKQASFIDKQKCAETFFFSARNALKEATKSALNNEFKQFKQQNIPLPFHLLMLGGDDLLLVCQAKKAHGLVQAIDKELQKHIIADGKPLTMAYGIAIASHTLPFYRLYHCAEALNASAKVLARSEADKETSIQPSCIDWQIVTQSWIDDPIAERNNNKIVRYQEQGKNITLLLTQKPYLLTPTTDETDSPFSRLNQLSESLHNPQNTTGSGEEGNEEPLIARTQLLRLQATLPKGRLQTKYQLNNLTKEFRIKWNQFHRTPEHEPAEAFSVPSQNNPPNYYATQLGDLIELIELQYLQRENTPNPKNKESRQ